MVHKDTVNCTIAMFNCTETLCPNQFCYRGQCFKKCPSATVGNGSICITIKTCHRASWVTCDGKCMKNCPPSSPIHNPGLVNNTDCISKENCFAAGWHLYNNKCLKYCPFATTSLLDEYDGNYCKFQRNEIITAGVSALLLIIITAACIFLLKNPKRKTMLKHQREEVC